MRHNIASEMRRYNNTEHNKAKGPYMMIWQPLITKIACCYMAEGLIGLQNNQFFIAILLFPTYSVKILDIIF